MFKKLFFLAVIATCLVALILTAGTFVLEGSPGMALLPVSVVLVAVFVYIKKIAN